MKLSENPRPIYCHIYVCRILNIAIAQYFGYFANIIPKNATANVNNIPFLLCFIVHNTWA